MQTQIEASAVLDKTRELCQAILDDPGVTSIRQRIDAFMADDAARGQYEAVVSRGQALQEKQQKGVNLSPAEISDFEKHRDALVQNSVARGFLDAQEELHEVQGSIQKMVSKTFDLGRLPTEADLEEGSCGSGCGCH